MTDDTTLLRRYAEGRAEDVFAELVRRHLGGVYSSALRRVGGDVHLAEDVTQVVFAELARQAGRLTDRTVLTGWLYTTTRNAAANVVRTERRRKAREQAAQTMNDMLSDETSQIDWSRVAPVLDEVIDQLGETDRVAILLRFVDWRAFAEIGAALELNEDAARRRVERALAKLRVLLEGRGIRSTSVALGLALTSHSVLAAPPGLAATVIGSAAAGPSAGAATATGMLAFMTTTKFLGTAAAVLALAAVCGVAVHQRQEADAALVGVEREIAMRQAELTKLAGRRREAEQAVAEWEAKASAVRSDAAGAAATLSPATPEDERARRLATWDPLVEGRALMDRYPELKRALVEQRTAMYRSRYAPLFRELSLSEKQIETLIGLLLDRSTISFPFGPGGLDFKLPVGRNLTTADVQPQLQALLGKEGVRKYRGFNEAAPARDIASGLARILCFSDAPLSVEQSTRVAAIIAENRVKGRSFTYDWDAITRNAQSVLAAQQLNALALLRRQQEADLALRQAESDTAAGGAKAGKS